ncbi:MAG: hypothetical protein GX459_11985 [Bacteroidales bacterium]|nr:hypothetical protein [Bacteroidales bacterium]
MKKIYFKPEIEKVEIDVKFILMLTPAGFKEAFWKELAAKRRNDSGYPARKVFDELNESYYRVFGVYRYTDYDSFRRRIKKAVNKG